MIRVLTISLCSEEKTWNGGRFFMEDPIENPEKANVRHQVFKSFVELSSLALFLTPISGCLNAFCTRQREEQSDLSSYFNFESL